MAKKQSKEREVKAGLCPNCHKFGTTCTCGLNYGFATGGEFRKWKNSLEQQNKYIGTIRRIDIQEKTLSENQQIHHWTYGIGKIVDLDKATVRTCFVKFKDGIKEIPKIDLKTLYIGYSNHNSKIVVEEYFPLKYSQWEKVIENNEFNKVVEFEMKITAYDSDHNKIPFAIEPGDYRKFIAKIIPNKKRKHSFTLEEVKNIAELAFEAGRQNEKDSIPAIIGESIGKDGESFDDWWLKNKDNF